jgi:hypothetical protein
VLSANGKLFIQERAVVGKTGDSLPVANLGSRVTEVEERSTVNGNVFSVAPVGVENRALVTGNVQSAHNVRQSPHATVGGTVTSNTPIGQASFSWTVTLPGTNAGPVDIDHHASVALAPGAYGKLNAAPGTTLSLSAGTYFFTSFIASGGSTVNLDESAGPILIYDTGDASLGGTWVPKGGKTLTNLLFVAIGGGTDSVPHEEDEDDEDDERVEVATAFSGTIVAMERFVDLDPAAAPDVGQVFAKGIQLSHEQTILLGGFDWGTFCPFGDTDGDGTPDCTDNCPLDPSKTTPGVCGCGVSEKDTDGDGIPDCIDQCPNDPTKSVPGQCGCGNSPQPAGTPCTDGICSGVTGNQFACDGAGQCGNPSACAPDPSCVAKVFNQFVYWICPGPATWSSAQAKCDAVQGQSLLEVDTREENAVLAGLVKKSSWMGANDRGAVGTWAWAVGANDTGNVFFANGATASGRFSSWASGAPDDNAGQCGSFTGASGVWSDTSCSASLGYVCKRSLNQFVPPTVPPITCASFPGLACPTLAACVPSAPDFVDAAVFRTQVNTCQDAGCTSPGAPGCSQCVGAAAVPPPGSTCTAYSGTACGVEPGTETKTCNDVSECASGQVCNVTVGGCSICDNLGSGTGACTNPSKCASEVKHCGAPVKGCAPAIGGGLCHEVVLCAPDGSAGIVDPRANPGSQLTPQVFDPASVFEAGAPPTPTYPPDPACPTPPCTLGPSNGWCKYLVPTQLPAQDPSNSNPANSGTGGIIQFDFDPNLALHFDGNPLALGESNFDLKATASLKAGASFNIPLVGQDSFDIVDALALITANRCNVSDASSHLKILGQDFLPSVLIFDTDPSPVNEKACQDALAKFETTVDRAKKALKDAEALLTQYNANKAAGQVFGFPADAGPEAGAVTLCQQIAASPPAGFPVGDCANETPEATINRFIQFYTSQAQTAFLGQWDLGGQELTLTQDIPINFLNNSETQTLFEATFFIGPIPCLLQVQAVEGYGIGGNLHFNFSPGSVLSNQDREQIANINGNVAPYANAGISLFVGVGFDIGVASASAGVEGEVSLGNVSAPIVAGAGLDIASEPDPRPLPTDLANIAGALPLITPRQYQFFLDYNYGAQVDISQILQGYLAARLEVSFLFWSASWTQTIVRFDSPFPPLTINLISGDGTTPALGSFPWVTVQMPTPFVSLPQLQVPSAPITTAPDGGLAKIVQVDKSQVEKFFYDSLCTCVEAGVPPVSTTSDCFRNEDCCPAPAGQPAIVCFSDPALGHAKSCESCRKASFFEPSDAGCDALFCGTTVPAQSCNQNSDCCQGDFGTQCTGGICVDNPGPPIP